jgi:hypothetical protein
MGCLGYRCERMSNGMSDDIPMISNAKKENW